MATHSSILAWEIPWMEEPSGLQSMGLQRVGHDLVIEHAHMSIPVFQFTLPSFGTYLPSFPCSGMHMFVLCIVQLDL